MYYKTFSDTKLIKWYESYLGREYQQYYIAQCSKG